MVLNGQKRYHESMKINLKSFILDKIASLRASLITPLCVSLSVSKDRECPSENAFVINLKRIHVHGINFTWTSIRAICQCTGKENEWQSGCVNAKGGVPKVHLLIILHHVYLKRQCDESCMSFHGQMELHSNEKGRYVSLISLEWVCLFFFKFVYV